MYDRVDDADCRIIGSVMLDGDVIFDHHREQGKSIVGTPPLSELLNDELTSRHDMC